MYKELNNLYKHFCDRVGHLISANIIFMFAILKYYDELDDTLIDGYNKDKYRFFKHILTALDMKSVKISLLTELENLPDERFTAFSSIFSNAIFGLKMDAISENDVINLINIVSNYKLFDVNDKISPDGKKLFYFIFKSAFQQQLFAKKSSIVPKLIQLIRKTTALRSNINLLIPFCEYGSTLIDLHQGLSTLGFKFDGVLGVAQNYLMAEYVYFDTILNKINNCCIIKKDPLEYLNSLEQNHYDFDMIVSIIPKTRNFNFKSDVDYYSKMIFAVVNIINLNSIGIIAISSLSIDNFMSMELRTYLIEKGYLKAIIQIADENGSASYSIIIVGRNILWPQKVLIATRERILHLADDFINIAMEQYIDYIIDYKDKFSVDYSAIKNNGYRLDTMYFSDKKSSKLINTLDDDILLEKNDKIKIIKNKINSTDRQINELKQQLKKIKERSL